MSELLQDLRSHFGFASMPFTREIATKDRWDSCIFERPLSGLMRTVEQRMSGVLLAPSGTGKTLLLRTLCFRLPQSRYRLHQVNVTSLSKRDMYREIALTVGIEPAGTYPALLRKLQEFYRSQSEQEGLRPVLLIDEAQDMRPEVLATLRILTNFEMDSRLVLSLVLTGDSRLRVLLEHHELEPIRRRMAHFATLRLLSRSETRTYIEHRLRIVGCNTVPFDEQALDAVYEISRGNLRAINHLCRKALELTTDKGLESIDSGVVAEARASLLL